MKNKYEFWEIIKIQSELKKHKLINGREGIVLAMGENKDGTYGYSISVIFDHNDLSNNEGWDIEEQYLKTTGKFMKREDFYDGSTAKVGVDEKGRGHIKELNLKEKPGDKND